MKNAVTLPSLRVNRYGIPRGIRSRAGSGTAAVPVTLPSPCSSGDRTLCGIRNQAARSQTGFRNPADPVTRRILLPGGSCYPADPVTRPSFRTNAVGSREQRQVLPPCPPPLKRVISYEGCSPSRAEERVIFHARSEAVLICTMLTCFLLPLGSPRSSTVFSLRRVWRAYNWQAGETGVPMKASERMVSILAPELPYLRSGSATSGPPPLTEPSGCPRATSGQPYPALARSRSSSPPPSRRHFTLTPPHPTTHGLTAPRQPHNSTAPHTPSQIAHRKSQITSHKSQVTSHTSHLAPSHLAPHASRLTPHASHHADHGSRITSQIPLRTSHPSAHPCRHGPRFTPRQVLFFAPGHALRPIAGAKVPWWNKSRHRAA